MDFILKGHDCEHAVQTMIQVFFPNEGYKRRELPPENGKAVVSELRDGVCYASVVENGAEQARGSHPVKPFINKADEKKALTQALALAIYKALSDLTGYRPPWGTLTGVRPAKIITELRSSGFSYEYGAGYLREAYNVGEDKISLCLEVARAEERFIAGSTGKDCGIYIGIPFCPTRCRYCSFVSYPMDRSGVFLEDYFRALFKELDYLGNAARDKNVRAVYVGGGTPTSLEPNMLDKLLLKIKTQFDEAAELTVEAGRPDSINREKLAVLKAYGVTRIAINPQTMSEVTLKRIGRNHTPADFLRAYELAEGMGFDNINCDVIMGLPGEGPADAEHTFETLARLNPASVTVHTLAMKRAAELNQVIGRYGAEAEKTAEPLKTVSDTISRMLEISRKACASMGQRPHYMYRQKNMAGNFENVGYARDGYECIYNLQTMTEAQSVLAAGAGAVTKVIYPSINLIKRAFNVRDIAGYIGRIDEMIGRKRKLLSGE